MVEAHLRLSKANKQYSCLQIIMLQIPTTAYDWHSMLAKTKCILHNYIYSTVYVR
jgi:hypothetical protein